MIPFPQVLALIFGAIFFQQQLDQTGYRNICGALFIILTNSSFGWVLSSLTFTLNRNILMREMGIFSKYEN
jgi:hypothetical protein